MSDAKYLLAIRGHRNDAPVSVYLLYWIMLVSKCCWSTELLRKEFRIGNSDLQYMIDNHVIPEWGEIVDTRIQVLV